MAIQVTGHSKGRDSEVGKLIESFLDGNKEELSINAINLIEELAGEVDSLGKEQENLIKEQEERIEELEGEQE